MVRIEWYGNQTIKSLCVKSLVTVWQILKTPKVERVDGIEMEGATGLARDISESQVSLSIFN